MQKIKKRIWSILIVGLTLLLLLPASALAANNPFTDISTNDWYYDEIQYVYDNGIMQGTSATTFNPAASTSRGMIATILYRIEGSPAVSGNQFSDVKASDYFANAVSWAAKNGIVNGYGDGTFKPNQPISREEMAAMVYRYAQYKNYDVSARADLSKYTDASTISSYALTAMQWVNKEGIIGGTSTTTLSPTKDATRGEVAAIFYRFCTITVANAAETYTVTFDYNYIGAAADKVVFVKVGDTVKAPADPKRDGYTFTG